MKVYLCEKPSQAVDLAHVIGFKEKKATHVALLNGDIVVWAFGHLLEMPMPGDIDPAFKKWSEDNLPILPDRIPWIPKNDERSKSQLSVIGEFLKDASEVIIATDAEREGELIGQNIIRYHKYRGPISRLWLQALDEDSIRKALDNLQPIENTTNLYYAALARAKSDWLIGMNASRAATLRISQDTRPLAVGRVQTPTLSIIRKRELEIECFQNNPPASKTKTSLRFSCEGKEVTLSTTEEVDLEKIKSLIGSEINIHSEKSSYEKEPPILPNLSTLQEKSCAIWGWTAEHTLNIAQSLYEKHKVLSYPRSPSRKLPVEQKSVIPKILKTLEGTNLESLIPIEPVYRDSNFVDSLSTAHHAIIPTTKKADFNSLSQDERKLYLLTAKFFIAALSHNAVIEKTTNCCEVNNVRVTSFHETVTSAGWSNVASNLDLQSDAVCESSCNATLNEVLQTIIEPTAPLPYTDGTLIHDLTNVRKFITSEDILSKLSDDASLGTEATRANMISELVKSGYVNRDGVFLITTDKARNLIAKIEHAAPRLVDPSETAVWESGLVKIENGEITPQVFLDAITKRVVSNTEKLLSLPKEKIKPENVSTGKPISLKCPISGVPIRDAGFKWILPGNPELFCPKKMNGRDMAPSVYVEAFVNGKSTVLDGFVKKSGGNYSAAISYNCEDKRFRLDFN